MGRTPEGCQAEEEGGPEEVVFADDPMTRGSQRRAAERIGSESLAVLAWYALALAWYSPSTGHNLPHSFLTLLFACFSLRAGSSYAQRPVQIAISPGWTLFIACRTAIANVAGEETAEEDLARFPADERGKAG